MKYMKQSKKAVAEKEQNDKNSPEDGKDRKPTDIGDKQTDPEMKFPQKPRKKKKIRTTSLGLFNPIFHQLPTLTEGELP